LAFGAYGIFMAASIGACLDLALSLYLIVHRFGYRLAPSIDLGVVRSTFRFFISNYFAGLLAILPVLVLPIMVLNKLGPTAAAFYYIDMMIVNLLYVIPFASAQSLFAEGSYDEAKLISHAKKAAKLNLLLIGPASLVLLLAGHFVLSVYGHTYASDGTILLQIL